MTISALKLTTLTLAAGLLSACGGSTETAAPEAAAPPAAAVDCPAEAGITYLCGLQGAEDLLSLGLSGRILASGMSDQNNPGHMYLIDPATM